MTRCARCGRILAPVRIGYTVTRARRKKMTVEDRVAVCSQRCRTKMALWERGIQYMTAVGE